MNLTAIMIFSTDIITGINVVLVFGAALLVLEIIISLGFKGSYILGAGWRFLLPAIIVLAVIRVYDFFFRYTPLMLFFREIMSLVFIILLFTGILVQYLAIRAALDKRM